MNKVNEVVKKTFDNKYVSYTAIVLGIAYIILVAPHLPPNIAQLFGQKLFSLIVLLLIVFIGLSGSQYFAVLALILAIGYIVSVQRLCFVQSNHRVNFSEKDLRDRVLQQQQTQPPDVGFETGTVQSGCYGSVSGLQGYDSADTVASY